nr:carboxymuconolactone decarboxylase family protein [Clostridium ragsdalei]
MTKVIFDSSLKYHMANAKNKNVAAEEIAEAITHLAFYVGWPNAWAAFTLAKEVWEE